MKKASNFVLVLIFILIWGVCVQSKVFVRDVELMDIIIFDNFEYKHLKDDFLKQIGVDVNYVSIFNDKQEEITESNFRELVNKFENVLVYEYKDIFGKKISKNRKVYIFSESEFQKSISIDSKYKIKNVSVDTVYNDTSANKIFVGKIFTQPKLQESKDSYILKLDRNNKIVWGKMFEDSKINKFNKIISISEDEYCVIASGYRNSEWTDGFIARFDGDGNFIWKEFYGSSHIDDFKDVVALEDGEILVLAEVSNDDGDVKAPITINNPLNKDLVLLKYDSDGNIVWQNSVANENEITALKIVNNNENVIVFGEVFENINGENVKNIVVSGFDLNGKIKFSTIVKDFDEEILNRLF